MRHWFIQAQIKVPSSAGTKFLKYLPLVGSQNIRINHYTQRPIPVVFAFVSSLLNPDDLTKKEEETEHSSRRAREETLPG